MPPQIPYPGPNINALMVSEASPIEAKAFGSFRLPTNVMFITSSSTWKNNANHEGIDNLIK